MNITADPYVAAQPESRPFWQAAEEGRLLGKTCADCARFHWYPRAICPFCHSVRTEWAPLSGRGEVYACSTMRRADPQYTIAYVRLEEGPTLLTALVDLPAGVARIGLPVEVVFRRTEDGRLAPCFTHVAA